MPEATWPEMVSGLETARAAKFCAVQDGMLLPGQPIGNGP
jgi:hypothetical protein